MSRSRQSRRGLEGGLVHRAADALRDGPLHTLDLARTVLRIEGHSGAASAAVFGLLGSDDRFHVDGEGRWSLSSKGVALGRPLSDLRFAVVDVETTGGAARNGHRMTEVAVVEVHRGAIVDEWQSLLNPGRPIPYVVERITGISDSTVRSAPYFEHVADELRDRLTGRVFVAHNVAFDWAFVSGELAEAGVPVPRIPRLCTVKMARALVPRLRRRNLDELTRHFGVSVQGRHRAYGDALATARVFLRMIDEATGRGISDLRALESHLRRAGGRRRKPSAQRELLSSATAPVPAKGKDSP